MNVIKLNVYKNKEHLSAIEIPREKIDEMCAILRSYSYSNDEFTYGVQYKNYKEYIVGSKLDIDFVKYYINVIDHIKLPYATVMLDVVPCEEVVFEDVIDDKNYELMSKYTDIAVGKPVHLKALIDLYKVVCDEYNAEIETFTAGTKLKKSYIVDKLVDNASFVFFANNMMRYLKELITKISVYEPIDKLCSSAYNDYFGQKVSVGSLVRIVEKGDVLKRMHEVASESDLFRYSDLGLVIYNLT